MRTLILLTAVTVIATTLSGCNTCRQATSGWFNRGDRCNECPPPDCSPGMPRATMMMPGTQQVLPGPIEVAPLN